MRLVAACDNAPIASLIWLCSAAAMVASIAALGLAVLSFLRDRLGDPGEVLIAALAIGVAIPTLISLLLLPLPVSYTKACPLIAAALLLGSAARLWWCRNWLRDLAADRAVQVMTAGIAMTAILPLLLALLPWEQVTGVTSARTVFSTHAPLFPGDSYLQYRTAQFIQNRLPLSTTTFFVDWSLADRTPLFGFLATFVVSAVHVRLPTHGLYEIPAAYHFRLIDPYGYWIYRALSIVTNAFVVAPGYLLAHRFLGRRAATLGVAFAALSPVVLMNVIFTWPKLLAGFFIGAAFFWMLVKDRPIAAGAASAAAVLSHPLGALCLPGIFLVAVWRRRWQHLALSLGVAVVLLVPWFAWADLIYRHPARMLTIPIGHTMSANPTRAEVVAAWHDFIRRPLWSILADRVGTVTTTFTGWTFVVEHLHGVYGLRILAYNLLRATFIGIWGVPLTVFGYLSLRRLVRPAWALILLVPSLCIFLFWGIQTRPIVLEAFQPLAVPWTCLAAAELLWRAPRLMPSLLVATAVQWLGFVFVLVMAVPSLSVWRIPNLFDVMLIAGLLAIFCIWTVRTLSRPAMEVESETAGAVPASGA